MTGIVIITAGQRVEIEDYERTVRDGITLDDVREFLSDQQVATLEEVYEDEPVRVWGTKVENQWRKVQSGDIVLVYREGRFIAQARVVLPTENLELAEHLWKAEDRPWPEENPWKYLVFFDQFEEIDVELTKFNELVGYDENYIPQGFTRVADKRIEDVELAFNSVENAIAELTGVGERVYPVEDGDETEDQRSVRDLRDELVAAGEAGDRDEEFEQLVAEAFTRLGCTAQWIEGGGDTDVEITAPVHAIVDAKSRGGGRAVNDPKAARIASHRESRGAEYGIVVGPRFPPAAIQDAEGSDITLLPVDSLVRLIDWREEYGITPEVIFDVLGEPGAMQDDRLDQIDEHIQERLAAFEGVRLVLGSLERSSEPVGAEQIRWVLTGMADEEDIPETSEIETTLHLLSHPSLQLLREFEEGFELTTSYDNATAVLSSISTLVSETGVTEGAH